MDNQIDVIRLLAKNEFGIASLYLQYAEKLPEHKDFWMELSHDETDHGNCILELRPRVAEGTVSFNIYGFQALEVERLLRFIEEMKQDIDKPDFEMKHALSAAYYWENSMIENECFKVFEGDSPAFIKVMEILREATSVHREKVCVAMEQYGQKQTVAMTSHLVVPCWFVFGSFVVVGSGFLSRKMGVGVLIGIIRPWFGGGCCA